MHTAQDERTYPAVNRMRLLADLSAILPADALLTEDEDLRAYECDGLAAYRQLPLAVVLPDTVDQIQAILRLCHDLEVPVAARGAGTGLSGGALPHELGVVLSLTKFNHILEINPNQRTARVEPGARNLAITEAGFWNCV